MVVIPNLDYLTLVIAGAALFYFGAPEDTPQFGPVRKDLQWWLESIAMFIGTALFLVGAARAFQGAVGL